MRIVAALMLSVDTPADVATVRLSVLAGDAPVVLVDADLYFVTDAADVARRIAVAGSSAIRDRLDLPVRHPAMTVAASAAADSAAGTVVLEGRRVVGVLVADEQPPAPAPAPASWLPAPTRPAPAPAGAPDTWAEPAPPAPKQHRFAHDPLGWLRTIGRRPSQGRRIDLEPPEGAGYGAGDVDTEELFEIDLATADTAAVPEPPAEIPAGKLFRAYPDVAAPQRVRPAQRFSVDVGLVQRRPVEADPAVIPIFVPDALEQLSFIVQLAGFGFDYPDGIRQVLTVERDNPTATVRFPVVADDVPVPAKRVIEVSYEFDGVVVGQAYSTIVVDPAAGEVAAPAPVSGTGVQVPGTPLSGPHLTVDIRCEPGESLVEWVFHPRYPDVDRPSGKVERSLGGHCAQSFAVSLMNDVPNWKGSELLPAKLRGNGEIIADAMPPEFWTMLTQTWQRAREAGEQPTLLLSTDEPFIPWELAWVSPKRIGGLLPEPGNHLGCLWDVGRWVPAIDPHAADPRPVSPPPDDITVEQFAVVTGHYTTNALPGSVEEGAKLTTDFGAIPVSASEGDIAKLLSGTLTSDGAPVTPSILHFAAHGEVDPGKSEFTGIILESGRHLDPVLLRGSTMLSTSRPFLFVNACQVGTAAKILNAYGGLAGSFLAQGAQGFIAPLWNIDDDVARDIAVDFYQATLGSGGTVAGALRNARSRYQPERTGSPTPLAYVFYGSPLLRLTKSA